MHMGGSGGGGGGSRGGLPYAGGHPYYPGGPRYRGSLWPWQGYAMPVYDDIDIILDIDDGMDPVGVVQSRWRPNIASRFFGEVDVTRRGGRMAP